MAKNEMDENEMSQTNRQSYSMHLIIQLRQKTSKTTTATTTHGYKTSAQTKNMKFSLTVTIWVIATTTAAAVASESTMATSDANLRHRELHDSDEIRNSRCGGCESITDWRDSLGDGCSWYEDDEDSGYKCQTYGHRFENDGLTANTACCACGGGKYIWRACGGGSDDGDDDGTWLTFKSAYNPSLCIDVCGGSDHIEDDPDVWLYPCNGSDAQKWYIDSRNHLHTAVTYDKCLVGHDHNISSRNKMRVEDCPATDDVNTFDDFGVRFGLPATVRDCKPAITIVSPTNPDMCLDMSLDQFDQGIPMLTWFECHRDYNQLWIVEEV